jgi:hypothetical protein
MKSILTLLTFLTCFSNLINAQTFVHATATGNNDGSSWENAYTTLHDALENYNENDEIWVAAGTYLPENPNLWIDSIKRTFYLHQDVSIYGGFNGTETSLDQRDPSANATILSGDLDGDDVDGDLDSNKVDNVINVVYIEAAISNATRIDGFTIRGGYADGDDSVLFNQRAGGIWSLGSPLINNCQFKQNYSVSFGAGLYLREEASAEAIVTHCIFESNRSGRSGGGMIIGNMGAPGMVQIDSCQFIRNEGIAGGGLYVSGSSAAISNCEFTENVTFSAVDGAGGGLYYSGNAGISNREVTVTDCTFNDNTSNNGGGFYMTSRGLGNDNITISNCDFIRNMALSSTVSVYPDGGAIGFQYLEGNTSNDSILILNCLLENNTAGLYGGGIAFLNGYGTGNYFEVNNCQIIGNNSEGYGGGILFAEKECSSNMEVKVVDCLIENNNAELGAGGFGQDFTSNNNHLEINNCEIFNNTSNSSVGGIWLIEGGGQTPTAKISNTHFKGNSSSGSETPIQGFMVSDELNNPVSDILNVELINCLFSEHHTNNEPTAVIGAKNSELTMINCTVANNEAPSIGNFTGGKINLQNTILQSDGFLNLASGGNLVSGEVVSLGGNLISDDALDALLSNTDQSSTDPLFEIGTFQLSENSPAVDAGFLPDEVPEFDLAGNARIQGGCLDIGVYESSYDAGVSCLTDVKELLVNSSLLEIYPNPVSDQLQISLENEWKGVLHLQVVNAIGQTVRSTSFEKNETRFSQKMNVTELPIGIYRLLVSDGEEMMVQAFVKQ